MAPATARFPFASSQSEAFSVTHDGPSSPSTLGKKKRGRPRKYSPDGNIALGLAHVSSPVVATSATSACDSGYADAPPKKHRGRSPGKKLLDALGAGGTGFTPHVILVESGENITKKVMAFSQNGPQTVCILSVVGAISSAILRQPKDILIKKEKFSHKWQRNTIRIRGTVFTLEREMYTNRNKKI